MDKDQALEELRIALAESYNWHKGDKWRDSANAEERAAWENRNRKLSDLMQKYWG